MKRAVLITLLCVTSIMALIMALIMISLISASSVSAEPGAEISTEGDAALHPARISNLEIWNIKSPMGSDTGFGVEGRLPGDTTYHMEYDPTWGEISSDMAAYEWFGRFQRLRSDLGAKVSGVYSDEVSPGFAGPWYLWIMNPLGTLAYGRIRNGIKTGIIDYNKPVEGLHMNGKSGEVEISLFSGRVRQGFREEVLRVEEGKRIYRLASEDIVPGSDFLQLQLWEGSELAGIFFVPYRIDYRAGILELDESIPSEIEGIPIYIVVAYDYYSPPGAGSGYLSQGAKITLTRGLFRGGIGYLKDRYERAPMEILSLGGLIGGAGAYLGYEYAYSFGADGSEGGSDPGAWSIELGYSPFRELMLIGRGFGRGEDFAYNLNSSGRPGQSGWSIEALGGFDLFNLSLRYGVERDKSNYEYPGELRIISKGLQVEREVVEGLSVAAGGSLATKQAPGDPAYSEISNNESWVGLRGRSGRWSYGATYGWGMKIDDTPTSVSYGRLLETRLYSIDMAQDEGDPAEAERGGEPGGLPRLYFGLRRELGRDIAGENPSQLRDGVSFGIRRSSGVLDYDLGGEIFKRNMLLASDEYMVGGSLKLGAAFMPSSRFIFKGDLSLMKDDIWMANGGIGLSAAIARGLLTEAGYRDENGVKEADFSLKWYLRSDQSLGMKSSDGLHVSMVRLTAAFERGSGGFGREWGIEADLNLPWDIIITPFYAREIEASDDEDFDEAFADGVKRSGVEVAKDFGEMTRLSGFIERAVNRSFSKMIYGIACRYNINRLVGIKAGYSWGAGFGVGIFDEPQGFWIGIENAF